MYIHLFFNFISFFDLSVMLSFEQLHKGKLYLNRVYSKWKITSFFKARHLLPCLWTVGFMALRCLTYIKLLNWKY